MHKTTTFIAVIYLVSSILSFISVILQVTVSKITFFSSMTMLTTLISSVLYLCLFFIFLKISNKKHAYNFKK